MAGRTAASKILMTAAALMLFVGGVYFAGTVYLENDEVAFCRLKQWAAGGKKNPKLDLSSNIIFRRQDGNVFADFRKLQSVWSQICLTTVYKPGSPYIVNRRDGPQGWTGAQGIGCWEGATASHLTLVLTNRETAESEYYQVSVPADLKDRSRGPTLLTDYRIPKLPVNFRQCSKTSEAVATCATNGNVSSEYCLLAFLVIGG